MRITAYSICKKMADDNNTCDSIAAGTTFTMYARDGGTLTAKNNLHLKYTVCQKASIFFSNNSVKN